MDTKKMAQAAVDMVAWGSGDGESKRVRVSAHIDGKSATVSVSVWRDPQDSGLFRQYNAACGRVWDALTALDVRFSVTHGGAETRVRGVGLLEIDTTTYTLARGRASELRAAVQAGPEAIERFLSTYDR